jgi:ATP-dependent Clp protease protease subunit
MTQSQREKLLENGIVFIDSAVTDDLASSIVADVLLCDARGRDVTIYINSPGGSIVGGLAIYDVMQHVKISCETVAVGMASSVASLILAGGASGKRFASQHSRIMIHQPFGDPSLVDDETYAQEMAFVSGEVHKIYAKHTGKTVEEIAEACKFDNFMTPTQAKDFGLVDEIV